MTDNIDQPYIRARAAIRALGERSGEAGYDRRSVRFGTLTAAAPLLIVLALAACAGSPAKISHMNSQEIRSVSNAQLCRTYQCCGMVDRRTPVVVKEVHRRGISCSNFANYRNPSDAGDSTLTEFGLRTMSESSPQPGAAVGPSFGGAVGRAGVGTLHSPNWGPGDPTYDRLHPTTSIVKPTPDGGFTIYTYPPANY